MKMRCSGIMLSVLLSVSSVFAQSWHEVDIEFNDIIAEMMMYEDDLYIAGSFTDFAGIKDADCIARWDGCEWHAVAPGLSGSVDVLCFHKGRLYVAGWFSINGGLDQTNIAYWDGVMWNELGEGLDYYCSAIVPIGDDLYVGGGFITAGGVDNTCMVARWDGETWHSIGTNPVFCAYDFTYISDMTTDGTNLYVTGLFSNLAGIGEADRVARWDGEQWHALGSGINPMPVWADWFSIYTVGDNVIVSGSFMDAGGNPEADGIALWDGFSWHGIPGVNDEYQCFAAEAMNLYFTVGDTIWRHHLSDSSWHQIAIIKRLQRALVIDTSNIYVVGDDLNINNEQFDSDMAVYSVDPPCQTTPTTNWNNGPELLVYPNPATDIIHLRMQQGEVDQVTLRNVTGQIILEHSGNLSEIDIKGLAQGVYVLAVRATSGNISIRNIVKQ